MSVDGEYKCKYFGSWWGGSPTHAASYSVGTTSSQGVKLTTHPHLLLSLYLKMELSIPLS
jgi:hypothetical protein